MQNMVFVDNNGRNGQISLVQPTQPSLVPWWLGCQPLYGESCNQFKALSGDPLKAASGQVNHVVDGRMRGIQEKGEGGCDSSKFPEILGKVQNSQQHFITLSLQSPPNCQIELGLGQSTVCTNYPYIDQCYGLFASDRAQAAGRILLPLSMTGDGLIYVNAKQYHGIVRRRKARAKAEMANKLIQVRKPYLHESRHLHAMRRPRGCGGRFLNTKKDANTQTVDQLTNPEYYNPPSRPASSTGFELLQSNMVNPNSVSCHLSLSGAKASIMYSQGNSDHFHITDHLHPSLFRPLASMISGNQGSDITSKWGVATDGCCNLLKV
ncbi:Nuclear transcription factor Y subunit A-10 [Apostasia shenzhenica]|uniref:Nuclear transcription factor Y subunit n=1 Tax=Apostasia shenzhenica TaxID=1088818 RepID=A0A2H9ZR62_9ASPA|nr:Nuclear transcription factor Y subunit A-10 [Apostasia shenzhenica]